MCLLCPLPTGSPMTPASWGVRRMLFGYSSHSRWLSCARRWFAEYPRLYTLHLTPYTLHLTLYALHVYSHHLSCFWDFYLKMLSRLSPLNCRRFAPSSQLQLYTPRPTQAFPPSVMCTAVDRRVSRVSVSIRVHPWAVYLRHLLCFASGLAMFTPLSFHSHWLSCSRDSHHE